MPGARTPAVPLGPEAFMSPAQAANYLGEKLRGRPYKVRTFYNLSSRGVIPPPDVVIRTYPRWSVATLDAWASQQIKKRLESSNPETTP